VAPACSHIEYVFTYVCSGAVAVCVISLLCDVASICGVPSCNVLHGVYSPTSSK